MKFKKFIQNLSKEHSNKVFFESVLKAYNIIFEAEIFPEDILLVDTLEAEQLSKALKTIDKRTDIEKEDLNKIYNTFVKMDREKFNEPFPDIFNKIKQMLLNLLKNKSSIDEILLYLGKFI